MNKLKTIVLALLWPGMLVSQQVFIDDWQQCFGGSGYDGGVSFVRNDDGSLVLFGITGSDDGDVSELIGEADWWMVKTDATGNFVWEKTLGGTESDGPERVVLTNTGEYIMFGETFSNDHDVSGNHGGLDMWLVKTDSLGNIIWQRCIGSSVNDLSGDMVVDSVGSAYVIGSTHGDDGDVSNNNGHSDIWFAKFDNEGTLLWDKNLGGSNSESGICLELTNDGGLVVGGNTTSTDIDVTCNDVQYNHQAWLVKLDSARNIQWQQCYSGSYIENIIKIEQTADTGYILLCITNSNDGDVSGYHGTPGDDYRDIWVVKVDSLGNIQWQRCLGGSKNDSPKFIKIAEEGGYLVGGTTYSNDGDVSGNHSIGDKGDFWLVKLSGSGVLEWQQCIGGHWQENLYDATVLSENRLILLGTTSSDPNSGDVNCTHRGLGDMWLLELHDTTVGTNETEHNEQFLLVSPNPVQTRLNIVLPEQGITCQSVQLIIYNTIGTKVYSKRLPATTGNYTFDVAAWPAGLYIMQLHWEGKATKPVKFIKQ